MPGPPHCGKSLPFTNLGPVQFGCGLKLRAPRRQDVIRSELHDLCDSDEQVSCPRTTLRPGAHHPSP